jgi:hypothetical protein
MSGTEVYHGSLQQPYRIQKRLVLNQCFCLAQGFWESWRERIPRGRIDQVVPAELSRPKTRGAEIDGKAQRGTRY